MNQINPKKLLHSKWTAKSPKNKEKHFIVTELKFDDDGIVIVCLIEAVFSKKTYPIDWRQLKQTQNWLIGWQ